MFIPRFGHKQNLLAAATKASRSVDCLDETGQTVVFWPWDTTHIESVGHAAYDMVGLYRAFSRTSYGFTLSAVMPCANAEAYVMNLAANTFSGNVDGSGTAQNYMQAQWLLLADWNPSVYDVTVAANLASGRYKSTTLMDATMLWMKNRRYLQFSVTPAVSSLTLPGGAGTNVSVVVAPLGGSPTRSPSH